MGIKGIKLHFSASDGKPHSPKGEPKLSREQGKNHVSLPGKGDRTYTIGSCDQESRVVGLFINFGGVIVQTNASLELETHVSLYNKSLVCLLDELMPDFDKLVTHSTTCSWGYLRATQM
jgi:hypothetical protein